MHPQKYPDDAYCDLIIFLFRWKVVTTRALLERFLWMVSPIRGYSLLMKWRRFGLIDYKCDPTGTHWAWTITRKGLESIEEGYRHLKERGYASEHFLHDLIVTAVHLGDWLKECPEGADVCPEQELRRCYPEHHEDWVPKTEIHRPDGYWKINSGETSKVVALEVELSLKSRSNYSGIGMFYSHREEIHRVVWVVRGVKSAQTILKRLRGDYSPNDTKHHLFVTLEGFLIYGWQAPVVLGQEMGRTLSEILHGNKVDSRSKVPASLLLLDTRKTATAAPLCSITKKSVYRN